MFIRILFFVPIIYHVLSYEYDQKNVIPGTKMSVNDDMLVSASNSFFNFAVVLHPFGHHIDNQTKRCSIRYNTSDRFVHSVSVIGIAKNSTDSEEFIFVFAAERISTMTPYVCIGSIIKSTCISQVQCTDMMSEGSHQEYFLIGVDTNGTFAYGFSSSFVFKLDIYQNKIVLNLTTDSIWPSSGFIPHAMDIADTWGVVAGYGYPDPVLKNYATVGCFINLSVLNNISCVSWINETTYFIPSYLISYNEIFELSVAIRGQKVLIGINHLSSVIVLENVGTSLEMIHVHHLPYSDGISYGRVVDWADDTTIGILVQNPFETIWSKSQIFVYDESLVTLTSPLFTFPNNQQILGTRLSVPSFARFSITIKGNMAILTDNADVLIIPVASGGYTSRWIDTTERVYVFYFEPKLCIGGTYKNRSSLGPCQICPPHTRNPGTSPDEVLECIPCSNGSSTSFCPLASLSDINLSTRSSYHQAAPYPETSDVADIEDILIKNIFQIGSKPSCLLISPLLWTFVVSGLCILILIIMIIIKFCECKQFLKYRKKAKAIFKHTDIIGEGEMWTGGLASLAIIVLISFSYWFSASFIRRYPIEQVFEPATFACDQSLINARFSTGLELLSIPKVEDARPIFELLDEQIFNLSIELINTGFQCNSTTVQGKQFGKKYIPLPFDCIYSVSEAITFVTFSLPSHQSTIQINMTGPYWIGAIRLCIRGQGEINMNSILRQLDFCQLYNVSNEAIGRTTSIPILFIKNINKTQPLSTSESTVYSGLWMPTFSTVSLSDELYYVEFGNYLRYTSSLTNIQIIVDEHPFFIKNIQQPIVRTAELIFHGLLFTSLCIEIFAFIFLLVKLFFIPLFRWLEYLWKIFHNQDNKSNHSDQISLTTNHSNKQNYISNVQFNQTIINLESDFSILFQDELEEQYSTYQIGSIERF